MKIKIIAVGKMKESWAREGLDEYMKRVRNVEIVEVSDEQQLLKRMDERDFNIVLDMAGKQMKTEEFADFIKKKIIENNITFLIGGFDGFSDSVLQDLKKKCLSLSFGKMTFAYQLMRIFLMEHIYRADMINKGKKYHR